MLLNEAMDVVLDVLGPFEDGPWHGDQALDAADGLARAEFDSEALRSAGEAIGDVDNHNRTTAYASAARRAVAALHAIVDCAASYPDGAPLLSDVSGTAEIETARGAPRAYEIIEAVVVEVAEDCSASRENADYRNQAIGMHQRNADVGDAQGTVWFPIMSGRTGVTRATLSKPASAKDWTLEAGRDAARIATHPEYVADDEVTAAGKGGVAKDLIARAVAAVILRQGRLPVQRRWDAFFEDALVACADLADDASVLAHGDADEVREYERECECREVPVGDGQVAGSGVDRICGPSGCARCWRRPRRPRRGTVVGGAAGLAAPKASMTGDGAVATLAASADAARGGDAPD